MDQLKEFLRQAVKYRFWIAIGVASILTLSAYFAGTGALAEEEQAAAAKIDGSYKKVKTFASGQVKNQPWTEVVNEKTAAVEKDVLASWQKLYERQAPLLDWPSGGQTAKLAEWGAKYPEGVDPQFISDVILDYTQAYPEYADQVYKSFSPFDTETGKGIVASPPKEGLLRPQVYQENELPSLGDVWSAQRILWIQRTILKVIADVNAKAKAKDWDTAAIKQVLSLEVANDLALDQMSMAKGEDELVEPEAILPPGQAEAADAETTDADATPTSASGRFGVPGGGATAPEKVQFLKSPNPDQYYIVPIKLKVYIEQNRIPDLLVEFKNSPMSIRVLDFEMKRPTVPVKKPRKGQPQSTFAGGMGRGQGMMGGGMMGGGLLGGMDMDMDSYRQGGAMSGYGKNMRSGMSGGAGLNTPKGRQGGKDVKSENIKALQGKGKNAKDDEKAEETEDEEEASLSNPYFNVVEVTIRGQARFYQTPPKPPTPEVTSPGETPSPADDAPTTTDALPADASKVEPTEADAEDPTAEPPTAEAPEDALPKGDAEPPTAPADTPKG